MSWVVAAFVQLASSSAAVKPYDEGLILYGASRIVHGAVPYRDFWSMYGPAWFYVLAAADRVLGETILTGRALDALTRAAVVLLVFALVRRSGTPVRGLAAALAVFVLLVMVRDYQFPALPATALALLAVLQARRAAMATSALAVLWPGIAVGLAIAVRPDFGLCAATACAWLLWRPARPAGRALFALGLAAVVLPGLVALVAAVGVAPLLDQLVRIPMQIYVPNRALPFPTLESVWTAVRDRHSLAPVVQLAALLPLPIGVAAAVAAVWSRLRARGPSRDDPVDAGPERRATEALIVLELLLCAKGVVRAELLHMLPALIVALVLVARLLPRSRDDRLRWLPVTLLGAVAVGGLAALVPRLWRDWHEPPNAHVAPMLFAACHHATRPIDPRLGCFVIDDDRRAVLAFLAQHAVPGATLYVGTGRHDKLLINNVELYFLSGLPSVTRWHDLHPGVQTTRVVQQAMLEDLARNPPDFVVLNTQWDDAAEPNASAHSSGVRLLDDYLDERYVTVMRAGTFRVAVPRALREPQVARS